MSGILASSMIDQDASCKVYTNSSGNAASITIHSHVPSTTENACLSIKVSGTDACICTNAVDSTTDITPTDNVQITHTAALAFDGFTCLQNTVAGKRSLMQVAYKDTGNTCHSAIDTPSISNRFTLHGVYSATGNRPVSNSFFGSCTFCCPRLDGHTQNSHCCYTLWANMSRSIPNFHTSTSGEKHVHLPVACCNLACYTKWASYNYHTTSSNCCFICTATPELKYETYYNLFNCSASQPDCTDKHHTKNFMTENCTGWFAVDLWSCFGTVASYNQIRDADNPSELKLKIRVRNCCEVDCRVSCSLQLVRCNACDLLDNNMRKILLEQCQCCACCCNVADVEDQIGFSARKPIMFGCDFAMMQRVRGTGSFFHAYRFECAACFANQYCQICSVQPIWYAFGGCLNQSCSCYACQIRVFCITDIGQGMSKYAWYNPYLDCNYIFVMDGTACNYGGTYSFETRCVDKDGIQSGNFNTSTTRCICKTFSEYIADGFFQKVQSTPTDWERFTCICANAGCFTLMSNPTLAGKCCWAVWAQCFNWGDTSLDAVGWNGCMLRYHSNDLANWKLTDDKVAIKIDQGSGEAVCTKTFINDGANFSTSVNHYFNSANCVNDAGTLEYKASANRLERTGIVVSNGNHVYVNNTGAKAAVTIWGYDE